MASSLYQPPEIVRVKRRKDDESVDLLYLEHKSKRTRTDQHFLFRRLGSVSKPANIDPKKRPPEGSSDSVAKSVESSGFVAVSAPSLANDHDPDTSYTTVTFPTPSQSFVHVDGLERDSRNGSVCAPPSIRTTRPGEERKLEREALDRKPPKNVTGTPFFAETFTAPSIKDSILKKNAITKQFQLSRKTVEATPTAGIAIPETRKRKATLDDTAVFVATRPAPSLRAGPNEVVPHQIHKGISATVIQPDSWDGPKKEAAPALSAAPAAFKRPGTRAVRGVSAKTHPDPSAAKSEHSSTDQNSDVSTVNPAFLHLLDEVQREEKAGGNASPVSPGGVKYMPRTPTRLKDRVGTPGSATGPGWPGGADGVVGGTLAEQLQQSLLLPSGGPAGAVSSAGVDGEGDESEGEYVFDTYVRLPTDQMARAVQDSGTAGIVVLDEDDEAAWDQYFVHQGEEFEDEFSEEDENAENYYAADYPDDEVDSDDERDRDPYRFRTNASDDEEFDFEHDDVIEDSDFARGTFTFPRPSGGRSRDVLGGGRSGRAPGRGIDCLDDDEEDDYVHDFDDADEAAFGFGSLARDRDDGGARAEWGNSFSRWLGMQPNRGLDSRSGSGSGHSHAGARRQRLFESQYLDGPGAGTGRSRGVRDNDDDDEEEDDDNGDDDDDDAAAAAAAAHLPRNGGTAGNHGKLRPSASSSSTIGRGTFTSGVFGLRSGLGLSSAGTGGNGAGMSSILASSGGGGGARRRLGSLGNMGPDDDLYGDDGTERDFGGDEDGDGDGTASVESAFSPGRARMGGYGAGGERDGGAAAVGASGAGAGGSSTSASASAAATAAAGAGHLRIANRRPKPPATACLRTGRKARGIPTGPVTGPGSGGGGGLGIGIGGAGVGVGAVYGRTGQMSEFSPELRTSDWRGLSPQFR